MMQHKSYQEVIDNLLESLNKTPVDDLNPGSVWLTYLELHANEVAREKLFSFLRKMDKRFLKYTTAYHAGSVLAYSTLSKI